MQLATRYLGLELRNPLVASASPLNADLANIRRLEDAGAAAVVLPSLFEEQIAAETARAEHLVRVGVESFAEALTYFPEAADSDGAPSAYLDLVRRASAAVDIPVLASLNGATDEGWVAYAASLQEAGAAAIELNLYVVPTDLAVTGAEIERRYLDVVRRVRAAVTIPIAVKLSPYFSAVGNMADALAAAGANGLVLFNRFYQPDVDLGRLELAMDLELSRSSELRLPLLWIGVLAGRVPASLAASTGVTSADEVIKYLMVGADVVMTTSALLRHGVGYMSTLLEGLRSWLAARDFESLDAVRGLLSRKRLAQPDMFERANYLKIIQGYRP